MVTELLGKYFWLVQTLTRAGQHGMTLEEIQSRWKNRWKEEYSRRSFNNHRAAIEECFGIRIGCIRGRNTYFIEQQDRDADASFGWMMDSMALSNLDELKKDSLKGRIAIENVPQGRSHLLALTGAMQDNVKVRIRYQKYSSRESSEYTIHPYALKENARRWYLVGLCEEKQEIRVYALDRILELEPGIERFEMPLLFDVDKLFAGCFGVYLPDKGMKRSRIVFKTTAKEAKYLQGLPIHESQQVISSDENSVTFEIYVYMNENLKMEFLSRGSSLEILEPAELREEIKNEISKAIKLYD
ncbi:MAG: WYL domain-containing protein [Bacteroidales bacterium]|nr:WYL domain-containing protein [Bacteroidales bacterium]